MLSLPLWSCMDNRDMKVTLRLYKYNFEIVYKNNLFNSDKEYIIIEESRED